MKLWTIVGAVGVLIIFGILLNAVDPYVPAQLLPLFNGLHAIYFAIVSIIILILNALIAILQLLKNLLPA